MIVYLNILKCLMYLTKLAIFQDREISRDSVLNQEGKALLDVCKANLNQEGKVLLDVCKANLDQEGKVLLDVCKVNNLIILNGRCTKM